ncbi:MAG TPA: hypothetical protein VLA92_01055 [Candidatus Saccharimonadales bacterium]|nr:hypothetical protein [Candidatus Saccharimonadales bacterium]
MRVARYKKHGRQLDSKTGGNRVSVEPAFTRHCPLILEGDILSLSPSFLLHGRALRDVPVGATHKLQPPGDIILSALQYGITFRSLCGLAEEVGITRVQLLDTLGFLNSAGALRRRRSLSSHISAMRYAILHVPTGILHPALSWRQRFSYKSLALATLRATWPVLAVSLGVAVVAAAGRVVSPITSLLISCYALPLFVGSIFLHELAHIYVLKLAHVKTDIMQLRLRLGVMHRETSPKIELYSALAGPFTGALLCLPGFIYGLASHTASISLASSAIALVHLCSLLPMYSDGAVIRKLHQINEAT